MFDLSKLSTHYCARYMDDSDADALLNFCLQNDQYYRYCGKERLFRDPGSGAGGGHYSAGRKGPVKKPF